MRVRGHSRSLKLVPFKSLGPVSIMAVSAAVCEIFNVKEWRDLENQVRGRSRSLKMASFDRPYATFYWSPIVNIDLSCTIFRVIRRWIISWPWKPGHSMSSKPVPFESSGAVSYSPSIVSNCGRICSRLKDSQCQRMAWPWKPGYGSFKVIKNGAVR